MFHEQSAHPFGFDISVSADKKKRTRGKPVGPVRRDFGTPVRTCWLSETAKYRAPKSLIHSMNISGSARTTCANTTREMEFLDNGATFPKNLTPSETATGSGTARPSPLDTPPMNNAPGRDWAWTMPIRCWATTPRATPAKSITGTRRLPPTERRALDILEARDHWTKSEIRKQYKGFVKDLHPDMNGGAREDEDRLQEVVGRCHQRSGAGPLGISANRTRQARNSQLLIFRRVIKPRDASALVFTSKYGKIRQSPRKKLLRGGPGIGCASKIWSCSSVCAMISARSARPSNGQTRRYLPRAPRTAMRLR